MCLHLMTGQIHNVEVAYSTPRLLQIGEEGCITLQFRSRHASTLSGANARVKRRFSCTQHTAQDLLHFIESLELRPLLSPASRSCVLTLDFPTRVVSHETEQDSTLGELGITGDSAVWVKFVQEDNT